MQRLKQPRQQKQTVQSGSRLAQQCKMRRGMHQLSRSLQQAL